MTKQHDPRGRIASADPWYTDDQFRTQLRTPGRRRMIENRWRRFERMIHTWLGSVHPLQMGRRLQVLDAGCGDGINLVGLARIAEANGWSADLVGVDYNPLRTGRAGQRGPGAHIVEASLHQLPWRGGVFDVVLCNHVLEHVPDLDAVLSELHRVLGVRGLFIAGVPNEGCLMGRLRNRVLQRSIGRTTDHVHFFTAATFAAVIARAGFINVRVERETFFFPCSYANVVCSEFRTGHALMDLLRRCFPSQAGGLCISAVKPGAHGG